MGPELERGTGLIDWNWIFWNYVHWGPLINLNFFHHILQGVRLNVYFCSIGLTSSIFVQNLQNMDNLEVDIPRFVNLKRQFDLSYRKYQNSNIEN